MATLPRRRSGGVSDRRTATVVLRLIALAVAACLLVDAWVHLRDAGDYVEVRTSVLSQATLFRLEGIAAIALAVALLDLPRRRLLWAVAALVLASAFAAVLLYTYVDIGQLGPVPSMYEPTWGLPGKLLSAWAEGIGAVIAVIGLIVAHRTRRRRDV